MTLVNIQYRNCEPGFLGAFIKLHKVAI